MYYNYYQLGDYLEMTTEVVLREIKITGAHQVIEIRGNK